MDQEEIVKTIHCLRKKLTSTATQNGLLSDETLQVSQELDHYLNLLTKETNSFLKQKEKSPTRMEGR